MDLGGVCDGAGHDVQRVDMAAPSPPCTAHSRTLGVCRDRIWSGLDGSSHKIVEGVPGVPAVRFSIKLRGITEQGSGFLPGLHVVIRMQSDTSPHHRTRL
jgi:hypothetical protein